jgi:hypothetical protein
MSFHWPRTVPVLEASGVWQHIVNRMATLGGDDGTSEAARGMDELMQEERREVRHAITGADHYQTLWEQRRR